MNFDFRSSRWPFDAKTPLGFLVQSFFGFMECFSLLLIILTALSFLIGSCWLFISFAEDITNDLSVLSIVSSPMDVNQPLCEIIKAFSDVHELSIVTSWHMATGQSNF